MSGVPETLTVGELVLRPGSSYPEFYQRYLSKLQPGSTERHIQAHPAGYDVLNDRYHQQLVATGEHMPLGEWEEINFLGEVRRDRTRRIIRERGRVMPSTDLLVGGTTVSLQDQRAMVRYTERPIEAGETNLFIPWEAISPDVYRLIDNPYFRYYENGVHDDIPHGGMTLAMPYSKEVPAPISAMRFMSYWKNLGHKFFLDVIVDEANISTELEQYARIFCGAFDKRSLTYEAIRQKLGMT